MDIDLGDSLVRHALICWIRASAGAMPLSLNTKTKISEFPWGTKGELNRIGERLRTGGNGLTAEEATILDIWRTSHFHVMNAFQDMLIKRKHNLPIPVAEGLLESTAT